MKSLTILWVITVLVVCDLYSPVAAGRLSLRPLSPTELRAAFIEAGGETVERSPDGRSISSALAGLKGFVLGVKNGIGGALLFDLATTPAALDYINNLIDNLNENVGNGVDDGGDDGGEDEGTIQEVCFNSRSLNGDSLLSRFNDVNEDYEDQLDNEDFYDDEENEEARQIDFEGVAGGLSSGLTCLVVNSGAPIVRHRRSFLVEKEISLSPEGVITDK